MIILFFNIIILLFFNQVSVRLHRIWVVFVLILMLYIYIYIVSGIKAVSIEPDGLTRINSCCPDLVFIPV